MTDLFSAYTLNMANYLCSKGHKMVGIVDSKKDPSGHYKEILFKKTDQLQRDIDEYYLNRSKWFKYNQKYSKEKNIGGKNKLIIE